MIINDSINTRVNESKLNESSDQITLQDSYGFQILIKKNGANTGVYCYSNHGDAAKSVADTIYKDLYPKKKIDYVDTRGGYLETNISVADTTKEIKRIYKNYKEVNESLNEANVNFQIDPKSVKYPTSSAVSEIVNIITDYYNKNKSALADRNFKTSFGSVNVSILHTSSESYPTFSLNGYGTILDGDTNRIIRKEFPISSTSQVTIKNLSQIKSIVHQKVKLLSDLMKKSVKENRQTDERDK